MKDQNKKNSVWTPDSQAVYTCNRIKKARPANRPILEEFANWLSMERGLSPASVASQLEVACTFIDEITDRTGVSCRESLRSFIPSSVEEYFVSWCTNRGYYSRRHMQTAMRSFLAFASSLGWVGRDLVESVPSIPTYRLSGLPRGLTDEEISTVLSCPWKGMCPLRDQAIIVLLATYGVRRAQISTLQFKDVDWNEGTIYFSPHKVGKAVLHVLTGAVAESLADYLAKERPVGDRDHIFLRHKRPYLRLSPGAISAMVRNRMVRSGLPPYYPHRFRHAFATRLLRSGQPVKVISDLLGHRSINAVAIYAKVDFTRLLEVAVEWPKEVVS